MLVATALVYTVLSPTLTLQVDPAYKPCLVVGGLKRPKPGAANAFILLKKLSPA